MNFIDAISVLSKSSSYAVSTESDLDAALSAIKSDLYVVMPIEEHLFELLESIKEDSKKVIFLCGSSGDGKSELLLRAREKFSQTYIKFHLDATHSFAPHDSAVDTLNKLFDEYKVGSHSLVIAINIGMLGNYAAEAKNKEIGSILRKYLEEKQASDGYEFLSFEDYPKFKITEDGYEAEFLTKLLARITAPNSLLYKSYIAQIANKNNTSQQQMKLVNYKLLCDQNIQKVIVELLFKIRLFNNQFITARNFLDFIYELICGKKYLFDNLFGESSNELLEKIRDFDPILLRTKSIDRFIISFELNTKNDRFEEYKKYLQDSLNIERLDNATSYIRLFYLLKFSIISNDYHLDFKDDFVENLLINYLEVYRHHRYYDADISKPILKNFYSKDLIYAIRNYINKKAPYLEEDQYLISNYGDSQIISNLKITPNFNEIMNYSHQQLCAKFNGFLKIKDHGNMNITIDINLFELLFKLKSGYRPRKNDRNVVVVLNTIVNRLLVLANQSTQITVKTKEQSFRLTVEDEEIEVAGIK